MAFSATEAATEGFRLARRKPGTLLIWGLYLIFMVAVIGGMFFALAGPGLMAMRGQTPTPTTDPAALLTMMGPMVLGFVVAIPIAIIMTTVLAAAIYRAVLRPDQPGFAYLRLGGDEFRMIGVAIALFFVVVIPYFVALVLVGMLSRMAGGGNPSPIVSFLGGLAVFCVYVWIRVRLSLALAMTVAEHKMRVFGSWGLTKGKFWPMLGMYLLVVVFAIVVLIVMYILIFVLMALGFGGFAALGQLNHPSAASLAAAAPLAIVAGLIAVLIYLVGLTLISTLTYAAQARAYRDLSGSDVAGVF